MPDINLEKMTERLVDLQESSVRDLFQKVARHQLIYLKSEKEICQHIKKRKLNMVKLSQIKSHLRLKDLSSCTLLQIESREITLVAKAIDVNLLI